MTQEPLTSVWNSYEHNYKGHKLLIKTRQLGGKVHIWGINGNRVIKTFKSEYNNEILLLKTAQNFINERNNNLILKSL